MLTAGFLVLTGTGSLVLSGAGIAQAQPAASIPATCTELLAVNKAFNATLDAHGTAYYQAHYSVLITTVDNYGNQLLKIAAQGSPALQSATKTFVDYYEASTVAKDFNQARFTADANRMNIAACTPAGAPRTGGGSSAGLQDPALFGVGGGAALAGFAVIGLTLRRRPRASADIG
jgi:hypothetical protein